MAVKSSTFSFQSISHSTTQEVAEGCLQSFQSLNIDSANVILKSALHRVAQGTTLNDVFATEVTDTALSLTFVWANEQPMTQVCVEGLTPPRHLGKQIVFLCQLRHKNTCQLTDAEFERNPELQIIAIVEESLFRLPRSDAREMPYLLSDKSDISDFQQDIYNIGIYIQQSFSLKFENSDHASRRSFIFSKKFRMLVSSMLSLEPISRPSLEVVAERIQELLTSSLLVESAPERIFTFVAPPQPSFSGPVNSVSAAVQWSRELCLCQARFDEAVAVLEGSFHLAVSTREVMQLRVAFVSVSFYRSDYCAAEQSSRAHLESFPEEIEDDELFWELAYYLRLSMSRGHITFRAKEDIFPQIKKRKFPSKTSNGRIYRTIVRLLSRHCSILNNRVIDKSLALCLRDNPPLILVATVLLYAVSRFDPDRTRFNRFYEEFIATHFPLSTLYLATSNSIDLAERYYHDTFEALHTYSRHSRESWLKKRLSEAYAYGIAACCIGKKVLTDEFSPYGLLADITIEMKHDMAMAELFSIKNFHYQYHYIEQYLIAGTFRRFEFYT